MKITICGLAGTGTSTTGKQLAEQLGYEFISSGGIFRSTAAAYGMDLHEFEDLCSRDQKYDRAVDDGIAEIGRTKNDSVVESRLAWFFIPDSFKVLLLCDDDTRIRRVAGRDKLTIKEAREKTTHREKSIRTRFREYYGIEQFDDPAHFDLVLDTTATEVNELVNKIRTRLDGDV